MTVIMSDRSQSQRAQRDRQQLPRRVVGTAAVYFGAFILVIAACDELGGGISGLPRFWYVNRTLWIGLGFLAIPVGVMIQAWRPGDDGSGWKPSRLGRRFQQLRVYSKEGCHLCD